MAPDPFPGEEPTPLERARAQGWTDEGLERLAHAVMHGDPPDPPRGHQRRGRWIGRLLITTTTQPDGAPLVDGGRVSADGGDHGGYVIRLRRGPAAPALVLAWRDAMVPWSMRARARLWRFRFERSVLWPMVDGCLRLGRCRDAPHCDACGLVLTGFGIYGGEDAPELCRWCAPQGPIDYAGPETRTADGESVRRYPE